MKQNALHVAAICLPCVCELHTSMRPLHVCVSLSLCGVCVCVRVCMACLCSCVFSIYASITSSFVSLHATCPCLSSPTPPPVSRISNTWATDSATVASSCRHCSRHQLKQFPFPQLQNFYKNNKTLAGWRRRERARHMCSLLCCCCRTSSAALSSTLVPSLSPSLSRCFPGIHSLTFPRFSVHFCSADFNFLMQKGQQNNRRTVVPSVAGEQGEAGRGSMN